MLRTTLCKALIWRMFRQQRSLIFILPLLTFLLISLTSVAIYSFPVLLTGPTRTALETAASHQLAFIKDVSDNKAFVLAFLLVQAPYFLALLSSISASRNVQTILKTETSQGGLEILLSMPYGARDVLMAIFASGLAITILSWSLIVFGGYLVIGAALFSVAEVPKGDLWIFLLSALFVSLSTAIWSAGATLAISTIFPRLMGVNMNTSSGIAQFVAIFPALTMFLLLNLMPDVNLAEFAFWAATIGVVMVIGPIGVLIRKLRIDLFLANV